LRITDPLSIPWHPISKIGQGFSPSFKYLSFIWSLPGHLVSLPEDKQIKVLQKLKSFISDKLPHVSQKQCASLHASLKYIAFIYQDAHSKIPALSCFLSKFQNDFVLHNVPHMVLDDLSLW